MQQDFSYVERGAHFSIKLWSEHAEALEQAKRLRERTLIAHEVRPLGEFGWLCCQEQPAKLWFSADSVVVVHPQDLLRYTQLRQAALDSKAHLEMDYPQALEQIRNSWKRLNPKELATPADTDYEEVALLSVFLLDQADPELPVTEGIRVLYEQAFQKRSPTGHTDAIGRRLSAWWDKHASN